MQNRILSRAISLALMMSAGGAVQAQQAQPAEDANSSKKSS